MAEVSRIIIGVDPGLRHMGWGVISSSGNRLGFVASGVIMSSASLSLAFRLSGLYAGLNDVVMRFAPREAAVEQTFVNKNAASALKLGQARGIALLVPAQAGLPVAEYAPNLIKKTIVGVGHASKQQIYDMVRMLLPGAKCDTEHAADALAIAITHAHCCRAGCSGQGAGGV
ncbi:MAG: crossover junction endodeoxyribonuclease RuvC [Alphaproteobacteria bacterium]|nr:crossover junction endodeoxyribonuclease RuvC [Alphaproteobacteria bacterium]